MFARSAAALIVLLGCGVAGAYEQGVHAYLSQHAYGGPATVAGEGAGSVARLRARIYDAGAHAKDPALRKRFLERYPDPERFDAWELKHFLALNPDKSVVGFDDVTLPGDKDGAALFGLGSRLPDDDERNRERFQHDLARRVQKDPFGQPLPDDPATLEMGSLTGLSSQAHAHYGLPHLDFSSEPSVLKNDPRRFAVPPGVHTFGADFADVYTLLAILASRMPDGDRLAVLMAGATAHHVEDVANQIHTVQVGLYDFFVDAKLESIKQDLLSLGGLLRARPTFIGIGIGIISNHHVLAEELYARHLLAPGDPVARATDSAAPDPAFAADLAKLEPGCSLDFGRTITEALIERSSHEGADVYRLTRAAADPRISKAGVKLDDDNLQQPGRWLRPGADLAAFYDLEVRGARRARQALDAWWQHLNACRAAAPESDIDRLAAERLIASRLDLLDAAAARRSAYSPAPPAGNVINWWVPGTLVLVVAVLALLVLRRRRRRA